MNAIIFPEKENHYPVLLNEVISIITPQYGGTFIDCTFGQGGYTKKILEYQKTFSQILFWRCRIYCYLFGKYR